MHAEEELLFLKDLNFLLKRSPFLLLELFTVLVLLDLFCVVSVHQFFQVAQFHLELHSQVLGKDLDIVLVVLFHGIDGLNLDFELEIPLSDHQTQTFGGPSDLIETHLVSLLHFLLDLLLLLRRHVPSEHIFKEAIKVPWWKGFHKTVPDSRGVTFNYIDGIQDLLKVHLQHLESYIIRLLA